MRMMAHGKPVLVTRNEENAALPDDAVIRVDPGESETEMLACYLQWLADDADARAYFGQNAVAYLNHSHALEEVAVQYLGILETHRVPKNSGLPFTDRGASMVESNRD
jgi:hypothetical protein